MGGMHVTGGGCVYYIYVAKLQNWVHIESTFSTYNTVFSTYSR